MEFSQFHFAQGAWLWGLLAIPIVPLLYALFYRAAASTKLLERFADQHLLPHLVRTRGVAGRNIRIPLLLWALAWLCGVVAMAGPRWNYTDEQAFRGAQDLVILLDLSQSMNTQDVKPSRIARAREEIEDLLDMNRGLTIGLVAYAAVPHMVTPLTDDVRTIKNLLPSLDTSLVTLQGDRLEPALKMAGRMLNAEAGDNKSILVISDGGFEENNFTELARAAGNATIYTMGVGTVAGAPVPSGSGRSLEDTADQMEISHLQAGRLKLLAAAGHGLYVESNFSDSDTRAILSHIGATNDKVQASSKSVRVWEERFYIPALGLALILLPFFRKGRSFPVIGLLAIAFFSAGHAQPAAASDLFRNRDQQAQAAFDKGDYKDAIAKFSTDYRRGVAAYRAGAYQKAAAMFKSAAHQKDGLNALYDLGNAQLMQSQPEEAIISYETVLKQKPHDTAAKHNLAIAKEMLEQKKRQQQQQEKSQKDQNQRRSESGQNKQEGQQQAQQQSKSGQQGKQGQEAGAQNKQEGQQQAQQQSKSGGQGKQGQEAGAPSKPKGQQQAQQQGNSGGQGKPGQEAGAPSEPKGQQQAQQQGNSGGQGKPGQEAGAPSEPKGQKQAQQQGKNGQQREPGQEAGAPNMPKGQQAQQQGKNGQQGKSQTVPMPQEFGQANHPSESTQAGLPANSYAPGNQHDNAADREPRHTQQDVNADEWLDRLQSDPGSFLKNQFAIEDRASGLQQKEIP